MAARDRVAGDLGVTDDWPNSGPARLLDFGLPEGFEERWTTRRYGPALAVRGRRGWTRSTSSCTRRSTRRASTSVTCGPWRRLTTSWSRQRGGRGRTIRRKGSWSRWCRRSPTSGSRMPISALRDRLEDGLLRFLWNEWSQLGVLGRVEPAEPVGAGPRGVVGHVVRGRAGRSAAVRRDPRLARAQRAADERPAAADGRSASRRTRRWLAAALAWLVRHRPEARFSGAGERTALHRRGGLFFDAGFPIRTTDEAFAEHGWERPAAAPSGQVLGAGPRVCRSRSASGSGGCSARASAPRPCGTS